MQNSNHSLERELSVLQKERNDACVSIIVPTHRLSPDRRVDLLDVRRAIGRAKAYLARNFAQRETATLESALDELFQQINFSHNRDGVGLFVSHNVRQLVSFYFPVTEKVIIADRFETRDLHYQQYYGKPYYVLLFSEKEARLFAGDFNSLAEVTDLHFPLAFQGDYEYSRPGHSLSDQGYAITRDVERDKSQLEQIRQEQFAREAENLLKPYLAGLVPLIITGTRKELATFKQATTYPLIVAEIPGNYFYLPLAELGNLTWHSIKGYYDESKHEQLKRLEESYGAGYALSGIADVWTAVQRGRGALLLVEKDFSYPGFLKKEDPFHLHVLAPQTAHIALPDAVNDLIELTLEKGGDVVMLDNGTLQSYQHIALITRY